MTLDVVWRLADLCGAPWGASAMRLTDVTWRTCAIVVSVAGEIRGIWPSLPFLILYPGRIVPGQPIGPGALARRFYDTGAPCGAPELVPFSAWLAGCCPEAMIQEHSTAYPELGIVLWCCGTRRVSSLGDREPIGGDRRVPKELDPGPETATPRRGHVAQARRPAASGP